MLNLEYRSSAHRLGHIEKSIAMAMIAPFDKPATRHLRKKVKAEK